MQNPSLGSSVPPEGPMPILAVEIWSDIVCPWCYIGKRRFEAALARFAHRDRVRVVWRSFQLDPGAPARSEIGLNEVLADKYGVSPARARAMNDQVTRLARAEGLDFRLDRARHGNTFDAHRLIHLAAAHGLQEAAQERLMRAYFTDGLPIGAPETLVAVGTELGLPDEEVRALTTSDAYADQVRRDQARGAAFGIRSVPFFVFDEQIGVSGAQTGEVFLQVLEQTRAFRHPPVPTGAAGCDDGHCAATPAVDS